ncbi:MAG TPA: carboxyltransferase domain-containing protein [Thermoanaerobaculia bacterium]|nr:carboxyltransferase domain-containing protein [Thermoanaerobaculia bacterium]
MVAHVITMPMKIAPAGDRACLVQLGEVDASQLHGYAAASRAMPGVLAVIPGHSSLYVIYDAPGDCGGRDAALESGSSAAAVHRVHRLNVAFDGADLDEFLAHTRQSRESFLKRVDGMVLTARYLGFRGGFAYLDGWPEEWAMPRRATSRPVPRGSFAIAGSVAGFYPIDSPGGWNLLGTTDADLEHAIAPGDEIAINVAAGFSPPERRHPVGRSADFQPAPSGARRTGRLEVGVPYAEILSAPLATLVHAPDYSRIERGISPGGPFDDVAAALANRAVGNAVDAPLLECAIAGPRLRFRRDGFVAWCGHVRRVRAGAEVAFGKVEGGLRGYLAFGEREGVVATLDRGDRLVIHAMRGPHETRITGMECEVTPQLDRVGIRLRPLREIDTRVPADLRSIGMQCGTVQLHPDGSLVAMGPDHPVTGGYLQPMTVLWEERWKLAQLSPGERVRFVLSARPKNVAAGFSRPNPPG